MSNTRHAIYGASLDPITNGHMWVINEGARLFDKLTVAVAVNPDKKYMFDNDTRIKMVVESVEHLSNVQVIELPVNEYLVSFAHQNGMNFNLRGIRNASDYEYEHNMQEVNHSIEPEVSTVYAFCPMQLGKISSSTVKGLVGKNGWEKVVEHYVPTAVLRELRVQVEVERLRNLSVPFITAQDM